MGRKPNEGTHTLLCNNLASSILRTFLHFEQLCVTSVHANQLLMRSAFDDTTLMHNHDLVAVLNSTEPMRNDNCCAVGTNAFNVVHDIRFRFTVETGRWLVAQ